MDEKIGFSLFDMLAEMKWSYLLNKFAYHVRVFAIFILAVARDISRSDR